MTRKVYTTAEEFALQNTALGTRLPYCQDTGVLNTPLTLGSKQIPNRLACQAMEGCDGTPDGSPDVLTKRRYQRFAKGGAGIIWMPIWTISKDRLKASRKQPCGKTAMNLWL